MIPCDECIVYARCKQKKEIQCNDLLIYAERDGTYDGIRVWLPNVITVLEEDPENERMILRSVRLPASKRKIAEGCIFKTYDQNFQILKPNVFLDDKTGRLS